MSGYSDNPAMVRVDFFKESGKWYTTEAVEWLDYNGEIFAAFEASLRHHLGDRLRGMWAICVEPYHARAFPLMVKVP